MDREAWQATFFCVLVTMGHWVPYHSRLVDIFCYYPHLHMRKLVNLSNWLVSTQLVRGAHGFKSGKSCFLWPTLLF